jgi:hypothetical protein
VTEPRRRWALLIAGVAIPVACYLILRSALHSDTAALAITETIPVAWALAVGLRQRRVDPIALAAAIVLAVALAISLAAGGSALPLKLRRAVVTGSIGIACLCSVFVRRPLLPAAVGLMARAWPQAKVLTRVLTARAFRQRATALTAIIGITLVADAAAQVTLAFSVSTATFVGVSRLARTAIFALGLGACALCLRTPSSGHSESDRAEAVAVPGSSGVRGAMTEVRPLRSQRPRFPPDSRSSG